MSDLVPIRRALISVSDKTGLAEFAKAMHHDFNIELISTGGTCSSVRRVYGWGCSIERRFSGIERSPLLRFGHVV